MGLYPHICVDFIAAWRHVVDVFRSVGASNVTWLWTVNATQPGLDPSVRQWWPGQHYVNWVGIDGYYYRPGDTFSTVIGATLDEIRQFINAPALVAETAVGTTSLRETQINGLLAGVKAHHMLGFVWFNVAQHDGIYHQDWHLEDDPAALAEFKIALAHYLAKA